MNQLSGWKTACAVFLLCAATAIVAPAQTFTTLATFNGANGSYPNGSLAQGIDGSLYGTTNGGPVGTGNVFKITPGGTLSNLYYFCTQTDCLGGSVPRVGLVLATDENFYGTTSEGGTGHVGTIFRISPQGKRVSVRL